MEKSFYFLHYILLYRYILIYIYIYTVYYIYFIIVFTFPICNISLSFIYIYILYTFLFTTKHPRENIAHIHIDFLSFKIISSPIATISKWSGTHADIISKFIQNLTTFHYLCCYHKSHPYWIIANSLLNDLPAFTLASVC